MGVIASPHEIVLPKNWCGQYRGPIILVREEDVALKALARRYLICFPVAVVLRPPVMSILHLLDYDGHPARIKLGAYEFQLRVSIKYARENQLCKKLLSQRMSRTVPLIHGSTDCLQNGDLQDFHRACAALLVWSRCAH